MDDVRLANSDAGGTGGIEVIVAKTKMRRIVGKDCPTSFCSGNWKYGKPAWCPLVEIKEENYHDK